MSLSGFPPQIDVVLGSGWNGVNGLSEDVVIYLSRVGATDIWTEDGTESPNVSSNRIRFAPTSPPMRATINAAVFIWEGYIEWEDAYWAEDSAAGDPYVFRELWLGAPDSWLGDGSFVDVAATYNAEVFKSMAAGAGNTPAEISAVVQPGLTQIPVLPPITAVPY